MKKYIITATMMWLLISCRSYTAKIDIVDNYAAYNDTKNFPDDDFRLSMLLNMHQTCQEAKRDEDDIKICSKIDFDKDFGAFIRKYTTQKTKYPNIIALPAIYRHYYKTTPGLLPYDGAGGHLLGYYVCASIYNFSKDTINAVSLSGLGQDHFGKAVTPAGNIQGTFDPPIAPFNKDGVNKRVELNYRNLDPKHYSFQKFGEYQRRIICSDNPFNVKNFENVAAMNFTVMQVR